MTVAVSRHKCLIYDGHPRESLPVIVPLLADGLRGNHRCLYLGTPEMVGMVDAALSQQGFDTAAEVRRGSLVLSSDRKHLENGRFDPHAMVDMLSELIDAALRDGFEGLCATGDMTWELGDEENFERLREYEALLEQMFAEKPLIGICQYRRGALPAWALQDALMTHRSLYLGVDLNRDNVFYVPPDLHLASTGDALAQKLGEWMYQQMARLMQAERSRDQALADLDRLNQDLECRVRERTAELEGANKDLESFAGFVSHDLRAPLRAIRTYAAMLQAEPQEFSKTDVEQRLTKIVQAAVRMGEMINGLLDFSRKGRATIPRHPVDMALLAREVRAELLADRPGLLDQVKIGALPPACGDRSLLREVFSNLLDNALKYSAKRPDPCIEVGGEARGGESVYWVKDNGAGFDMRFAERLFSLFQRLHPAAEFEGSGVGLALVKRIVQRHGGRVWAEGAVQQGATISFSLPRTDR